MGIAQDKVALPQVNLHKEIVDGNVTAALADVGNVLSVGVAVHAAMSWVETQGFGAMPIIAGAFIVSQLILMLVARYRVHLFKVKSGNQACMQAMENHNSALGLRYAGFLIGASLAITAASGLLLIRLIACGCQLCIGELRYYHHRDFFMYSASCN